MSDDTDDENGDADGSPAAAEPADGERRRCTACGAALNRYSTFCTECGTRQEPVESGETEPEAGDTPAPTQQRGRGRQQADEHGGPGQRDRGAGQYGAQQPAGYNQPDRQVTAGPHSNTGMAAIAHLLGLVLGVLGPLLIYATTDDPFVKENAANATNWQIMLIIYGIISLFLLIFLIGFVLLPALVLVDIVFIIIATVRASDGEAWEYPLTPRLL